MLRLCLTLLLPLSSLAALDFKYDECQAYCLGQNPYSFTFTKMACPAGGLKAENGGFTENECDEDDLTIEYKKYMGVGREAKLQTRQTSLEEAMIVCSNKKKGELNGRPWISPEDEYVLTVTQCRGGHAKDGQGWGSKDHNDECRHGGEGCKNDITYTVCLQEAYNTCLEMSKDNQDQRCLSLTEDMDSLTGDDLKPNGFICTVCLNCPDSRDSSSSLQSFSSKLTCEQGEGSNMFKRKAETCFDDESKKGFRACINEAQKVYNLRVREREEICKKKLSFSKSHRYRAVTLAALATFRAVAWLRVP